MKQLRRGAAFLTALALIAISEKHSFSERRDSISFTMLVIRTLWQWLSFLHSF